ncbi:ankyrin repeat domain-containing protein 13A-like [Sinocyclocheilus anshuiensis]|uniref:ankyrin repeat domain-containing protein 13A-like n=1 Tax=Sinocyclocheilus anshuiensis TaxID=1608454 RepID=UPI0007B7C01A|nr:PREDICTED: ankyrin repeat domain-containing protein 13A-like [Sinocyclocheilus anshuiensis]
MLSATAASVEDFSLRFPLHALVWENDYRKLEKEMQTSNIEEVDPRGRTPLHLAVSLGHLESVRVLLRHGADVSKENDKNWTVLQEAVSTGDPEMVQLVLQRRDYRKASTALGGVPELLCKIREVRLSIDFVYCERNVLESLLGTVEQQIGAQGDMTMEYATATNPTAITPEEYFNPNFDLQGRDIGRPTELTIRTQKFKGTLWMSEEHPLSLVEQVTPIIDLMARTSTHFARLRDFINLRFPPGFPVKIEIPLFHVLNARITFGNVNKCSTDEPLDSNQSASTPTPTEEKCDSQASGPAPFKVCPSVFVAPSHYHHRGGYRHSNTRRYNPASHDEELLQYAIHQSLLESSALKSEDTWSDSDGQATQSMMNRLSDGSGSEGVLVDLSDTTPSSPGSTSSPDSELRLAMELSSRAQEEEERRRKEEEEELQRILQLSLTEK